MVLGQSEDPGELPVVVKGVSFCHVPKAVVVVDVILEGWGSRHPTRNGEWPVLPLGRRR